nr:tRNA-specific adenosine deaminase 2 [Onthophagus taurus]
MESQNDSQLSNEEKHFMDLAFNYAQEALDNQEVPVGCIFVYNNQIIASGRNTVNETRNATRHAEINCIDDTFKYSKDNQLNFHEVIRKMCVYVTVEPCIMCAAALFQHKVCKVVFGCKNDRFGGSTVFDVGAVMKPVTIVKGGYRGEDAMGLLKEFYKGTNPNAPASKVKLKDLK